MEEKKVEKKQERLPVNDAADLQVVEGLAPRDTDGLGTLEFLNQ
jgi:hypothetical protein